MNWQWYCPTQVIFGWKAVADNPDALALGRKAFIVCGQGGSAKRNGALDDVCRSLAEAHIEWTVFDEVKSNPEVGAMRGAASIARREKADFVIGIGGGSPLDAAKAIAVLTCNNLGDEELFNAQFARALPLAAVPTTAGTGSEVTQYSILTYPAINSKKSIASPLLVPRVALLDPAYTRSLPREITVDTAVDAFSHVFESYLTVRHSPMSDVLASEAMFLLGGLLRELDKTKGLPDDAMRSQLLYASMLAGTVISQTGTSIPHALGYSFTYFKGTPHGRANGYIMPALAWFLNGKGEARAGQALEIAGFRGLHDFSQVMLDLTGPVPMLSEEEKRTFLVICSQARNLNNSLVKPSFEELQALLEQVIKPSF
ncbi:MAG: iron-containing alcohol dehydrogenase family protein [Syntrophomonadaceae bacterium]